MALRHAGTLEKIHSILPLGKEQPAAVPSHRDAEEVVQVAEVRHGELRAEARGDVLEKGRRRRGGNDVIDVEKEVGQRVANFVDEQGGIRLGEGEADAANERGEALVPSTRRLLKSIQGLL